MGNKNCPSFWRNAVKARLSLRSAIWYSDMEAAPFGKINWVNPILPDRTDRSRSLFNLQLSAGHHLSRSDRWSILTVYYCLANSRQRGYILRDVMAGNSMETDRLLQ